MSITRRGFLKALLGSAAIGVASPLVSLAEAVEVASENTHAPVVFDLDKDNVGNWNTVSIVRKGDNLELLVNGKRVDSIAGTTIEMRGNMVAFKKTGWILPIAVINPVDLDNENDFTLITRIQVNKGDGGPGSGGGFIDELKIYDRALEVL